MARVIDKAAAFVKGIFNHTVAKVELRGSRISKTIEGIWFPSIVGDDGFGLVLLLGS